MKNIFKLFLLGLAILYVNPMTVIAQDAKSSTLPRLQMHHETKTDPYLPNAFNNKKVSPAYKYDSAISGRSAASTIYTTQVNIDSIGQNIIGDAANEPSIAFSPTNPDNIVIGWRQFDNISSSFRQAGWGYTMDAGVTWTFPGVIEPGIFRSDPVLDYDDAGNFYYNSLTNTPDYLCTFFKSTNGGVSWDSGTPAQGGDKQWVAIDRTGGIGNGNIYSAWTFAYTSCDTGFFTRSTNGNASYDSCTLINGQPYWLTMDVGNNGDLFIGGAGNFGDLIFVKSPDAQTPGSLVTWSAPVSVFMDGYLTGFSTVNPSGLIGQMNIGVDKSNGPGQGNIYMLATMERFSVFDPADVMFVRSVDDGVTWSAPIKVNDDISATNTQWLGAMAVAPTGRIDAVWLDTRDATGGNPDESALYYSYSTDEGVTWSVNEKLSASFDPHIGYPNQSKMGDYFDMQSDSAGAHLAWCNTLNGGQDVYYSYIVPPTITGVGTVKQSSSVSVYPNPTTGLVTIAGISGRLEIEVLNILGETILSTSSSNAINIDISSQGSGIYFLKLSDTNGSVQFQKIIKR